ncbi:MAG: MFS transporter [Ilumatobacteraceae bacterium]
MPGRLSLRGDPLVDVLGVLTICVYGSWFYGFGVLIDDIGAELGMGATALGASFGAAQALVGLLALVTGRLLDRRGPSIVLGVIGPLGAVALGVSGRVGDSLLFAVLFAIGGGLTGAAGFYTLTQSVIVRADRTRSLERIIRLTIWGALASPIAIPVTELLRSTLGWRLAIEIPAGFAFIAFLASSRVVRLPYGSPAEERGRWGTVIAGAVRDAVIRWYALAAVSAAAAVSVLLVFQVSIMRWAGLSAASAAGFAGARGLLQLAGRLPLRRALSRTGSWRLLAVARLCVAGSCLIVLVAGSPVVAGVYTVLAGTSIGALSALDGIVARDVLPADDFGSLMGAVALLVSLGGGVAPVLAGRLTDVTGDPRLSGVAAASAAVASVGCLAVARWHRNVRSQSPVAAG